MSFKLKISFIMKPQMFNNIYIRQYIYKKNKQSLVYKQLKQKLVEHDNS